MNSSPQTTPSVAPTGFGCNIKAFPRTDIFGRSISLYLFTETLIHNRRCIPKRIEWEELLEGTEPIQAPFYLEFRDAQALMDRLWDCGLRPSEGTGSAGSLEATRKHLEDMRTLVFKNSTHSS